MKGVGGCRITATGVTNCEEFFVRVTLLCMPGACQVEVLAREMSALFPSIYSMHLVSGCSPHCARFRRHLNVFLRVGETVLSSEAGAAGNLPLTAPRT